MGSFKLPELSCLYLKLQLCLNNWLLWIIVDRFSNKFPEYYLWFHFFLSKCILCYVHRIYDNNNNDYDDDDDDNDDDDDDDGDDQ